MPGIMKAYMGAPVPVDVVECGAYVCKGTSLKGKRNSGRR
jgi:hypothetical protein